VVADIALTVIIKKQTPLKNKNTIASTVLF